MPCLNIQTFTDHDMFMDILKIGSICLSYIITFWGYKFMKPILFTGGVSTSLLMNHYSLIIVNNYYIISCQTYYLFVIISSLLAGLAVINLYKVANFLLGSISGGIGGYIGYELINDNIYHIDSYDQYYFIILLGFLGGIYTMNKELYITILITSLIGPLLSLYCIHRLFHVSRLPLLKLNHHIIYIETIYCIILSFIGFMYQKKQINKKYENKIDDTFIKSDSPYA